MDFILKEMEKGFVFYLLYQVHIQKAIKALSSIAGELVGFLTFVSLYSIFFSYNAFYGFKDFSATHYNHWPKVSINPNFVDRK